MLQWCLSCQPNQRSLGRQWRPVLRRHCQRFTLVRRRTRLPLRRLYRRSHWAARYPQCPPRLRCLPLCMFHCLASKPGQCGRQRLDPFSRLKCSSSRTPCISTPKMYPMCQLRGNLKGCNVGRPKRPRSRSCMWEVRGRTLNLCNVLRQTREVAFSFRRNCRAPLRPTLS